MSVARLFVYGSLRFDVHDSQAKHLLPGVRRHSKAKIRGRLYRCGAYPGLVLSPENSSVYGEVLRLHRPRRDLRVLDLYEECTASFRQPHEYRRVRVTVRCAGRSPLRCWVYIFDWRTARLPRLAEGVWGIRQPLPGDVLQP